MRSHDVRRILDQGRKLHGERLVLLLAPGSGNAAVIAGRRIGGAVQRNRARRIMRAAIREVSGQIGANDLVLVARSSIRGCGTEDVVGELEGLLRA